MIEILMIKRMITMGGCRTITYDIVMPAVVVVVVVAVVVVMAVLITLSYSNTESHMNNRYAMEEYDTLSIAA